MQVAPGKTDLRLLAGLPFERPQLRQQGGNIGLNNAPQGIVVNSQVTVNQAVARCDDLPPWNMLRTFANRHRDMHGRFAEQLQITKRGVLGQAVGLEPGLIETMGIGHYLFRQSQSCRPDKSATHAQTFTASRSMNGRNSGRMAFSVTRSTGQPSASSR